MAKNNSSKRRVTNANANRRLPFDLSSPSFRRVPSLREYEDRREFHPEGDNRPAKSFNRSRHRLKIARSVKPFNPFDFSLGLHVPTHQIAFDAPRKVLICVRRKIRKQVLHALNKTGKSGQRSPRFNVYSSVSCKG